MPFLDIEVHPVLELLSVPCVDHIRKPLTRKQMDLFLVRKMQHEIGNLSGLIEHATYTDVLVLRTENRSVFVLLDV